MSIFHHLYLLTYLFLAAVMLASFSFADWMRAALFSYIMGMLAIYSWLVYGYFHA